MTGAAVLAGRAGGRRMRVEDGPEHHGARSAVDQATTELSARRVPGRHRLGRGLHHRNGRVRPPMRTVLAHDYDIRPRPEGDHVE